MRQQNRAYVAVVVLAIAMSACAGTIRDRVRTSALVAGETAISLDAMEQQLAPSLTPEQRVTTNKATLVMVEAVRTYERSVKIWPESLPAMPVSVWEAQRDAINAIVALERVFEDMPGGDKLRVNLRKLRESIGG